MDLSQAGDDQALDVTRTPSMQEDDPAWAPDGRSLAYGDPSSGYGITYVLPFGEYGEWGTPLAVGQGGKPVWGPGGASLALAYQVSDERRAIAGPHRSSAPWSIFRAQVFLQVYSRDVLPARRRWTARVRWS